MKLLFRPGIRSSLLQTVITVSIALIAILTYNKTYTIKPAAASSHIVFIENSWDEALKQAKIQHKYIFVDAYASWCGYCKLLKTKTFTDNKAADFYNSNFVNLSIDMEKGQGPALAVQWQIKAYPTLIVFNSAGQPVLGTAGFLKADDLIRFGKQALGQK